MPQSPRAALRIATIVRNQLKALAQRRTGDAWYQMDSALSAFDRLRTLHRRIGKAQRHGWDVAARRIISQGRLVVDQLKTDLTSLSHHLNHADPPALPFERDILDELEQIDAEFGDWIFDERRGVLSVSTDEIELEGVFLGPFEIQLKLTELTRVGRGQPYDIEALDPRPAASQNGVTHPHVSDCQLCAGDASAPIRSALESGRLCDFFTLVTRVLETYNSESPYVNLPDWDGVMCGECEASVYEDERCSCGACDSTLCDSCSSLCRSCLTGYCPQCLYECRDCETATCRDCLTACERCGRLCCAECLDEELCSTCQEESENDHESEHDQNEEAQETNQGQAGPRAGEDRRAGRDVQPADAPASAVIARQRRVVIA